MATLDLDNLLHTFVFAGPNGSGKSSLIAEVLKHGAMTSNSNIPVPATIINPDQVSKDLPGVFTQQSERDLAAFHAVRQMRLDAIAQRVSFGYALLIASKRSNFIVKICNDWV